MKKNASSVPSHVDIVATNSKGKAYTLPGDFVTYTGGPISFATYCQRLGIPDGKPGKAKREKAAVEYGKLRALYETVSSIAWSELKKGATTVRRVACSPITDRKTKKLTGTHRVAIGLEIKQPADVTGQLETARLTAKAIRAASLKAEADKAKQTVPVVPVPAKLTKAEQAAIAKQLLAEQKAA